MALIGLLARVKRVSEHGIRAHGPGRRRARAPLEKFLRESIRVGKAGVRRAAKAITIFGRPLPLLEVHGKRVAGTRAAL